MPTYPRARRPLVEWGPTHCKHIASTLPALISELESLWAKESISIARQLADDDSPQTYARFVHALCEAAADLENHVPLAEIDLPVFKAIASGRSPMDLAVCLELIHLWEDGVDVDARQRDRETHMVEGVPRTVGNHLAYGRTLRVEWDRARKPLGRPVVAARNAGPQTHHGRRLPPTPHFVGRAAEVGRLEAWLLDPGAEHRVMALIGLGGSGKTAIVNHLLSTQQSSALRGRRVFVWSFRGDESEEMAECAVLSFEGERPTRSAAMDRLTNVLTRNEDCLLVLDGAEEAQRIEPTRGALISRDLEMLLRILASSNHGRGRALITSRFPLVDLHGHRGYAEVRVDNLDEASALTVLREWGVRGGDEALGGIIQILGTHPLSLEIAASFVVNFHDGDPAGLSSLPATMDEMIQDDPKVHRLTELLKRYSQALSPRERAVLGILSAFRQPVPTDVVMLFATNQVGGMEALFGTSPAELERVLGRLTGLGLISTSHDTPPRHAVRHAFLAGYFRRAEGGDDARVHDRIFTTLSLSDKSSEPVTDTRSLDRYEEMIFHSIKAGKREAALDLYLGPLGGLQNLGWTLGDYGRGARIARILTSLDALADPASPPSTHLLARHLAWYSSLLGDLETAGAYFLALAVDPSDGSVRGHDLALVGEHEFLGGRYPVAQAMLLRGLDEPHRGSTYGMRVILAATHHRMGADELAAEYFDTMLPLQNRTLDDESASYGFFHAEYRLDLGQHAVAREMLEHQLVHFERRGWRAHALRCHGLLGECAVADARPSEARAQLTRARALLGKSGYKHGGLRVQRLAAALLLQEDDLEGAAAKANDGLMDADRHGFGGLAIDFLMLQARVRLQQSASDESALIARQAYRRSISPSCWYMRAARQAAALMTAVRPAREPASHGSGGPRHQAPLTPDDVLKSIVDRYEIDPAKIDDEQPAGAYLELDSLAEVEFVLFLEDRYDVKFTDEEGASLLSLLRDPVRSAIVGLTARILGKKELARAAAAPAVARGP